MDVNNLKHRFAFHAAKDEEKKNQHTSIRQACYEAALRIDEKCPPSREKSLAITKLEEAMMWANAAAARND